MRRHLLTLAATAAVALTLPAGAFAAACTGVDTQPNTENLDQIAATTLCLINAQRAENALPELREQVELTQASVDYSELMVDEQFFAHESPSGSVLTGRLTDAGYLPGDGAWVVGENIAWGESYLGTPGAIVTAWMNSAGHRANILSSDYDEIGLGIAIGVPTSANAGATYTTDFGHRDGGDGADALLESADGANGTGGLAADATATSGAHHTTAARRTATNHGAARAKRAKTSCRALGHRGATRQALRTRCLGSLKHRLRRH